MASPEGSEAGTRAGRRSNGLPVDLHAGVRTALCVLFWVVLAMILWKGFTALMIALGGVLAALFFDRVAQHTYCRLGVPRKAAILCVLATVLAVAAGIAWWIGATLYGELEQLGGRIPALAEEWTASLEDHPTLRAGLERFLGADGQDVAQAVATRLMTGVSHFVTFAGLVFVVTALGVFLAFEPELYVEGAVRLLPERHRPRARACLAAAGNDLARWILGKVVIMLVLAAIATGGLLLIGMPFALTFGLLWGVLEFVPYLGPIVGYVAAAGIAIADGSETFLWLTALYLMLQGVESYVVTPMVQRSIVHLPPGLLILVQVAAGMLLGIGAVLLAAPMLVLVLVAVRELWLVPREREHAATA